MHIICEFRNIYFSGTFAGKIQPYMYILTIDKLHVVDEYMYIHVDQSAVLVNLL